KNVARRGRWNERGEERKARREGLVERAPGATVSPESTEGNRGMTQVLADTTNWPSIWAAARAKLRRDLGGPVFDAWLGKLALLDFEQDEIRFAAPKAFVRNWVQNNYAGRLEKALRAEGGSPKSITIVVADPKD